MRSGKVNKGKKKRQRLAAWLMRRETRELRWFLCSTYQISVGPHCRENFGTSSSSELAAVSGIFNLVVL